MSVVASFSADKFKDALDMARSIGGNVRSSAYGWEVIANV